MDRAAAAEARRLKILARGKDRLNQTRITVGGPPAAEAEEAGVAGRSAVPASGAASTSSALPPASTAPSSAPAAAAASAATVEQQQQQQQQRPDATALPPSHLGPSASTPADRHPTQGAPATPVAAPSPSPSLAARQPPHPSPDVPTSGAQASVASSGAATATAPSTARPTSFPDPISAAPATDLDPLLEEPAPLSTSIASPALPSLLGPALLTAVQSTRLLRILLAISLAYLRFHGVVLPAQLGLPPLLALLVLQVAVIAGARVLLNNKALRAWADLDSGVPASPLLPFHLRGLDLTALVPGLKGALQALSSVRQAGVDLWAGLAVFLVSYAVLQAVHRPA